MPSARAGRDNNKRTNVSRFIEGLRALRAESMYLNKGFVHSYFVRCAKSFTRNKMLCLQFSNRAARLARQGLIIAVRGQVLTPFLANQSYPTTGASQVSPLLCVRHETNDSVDCGPLSGSVLGNQYHAETRLTFHHASVAISSLFERNCLDHRADILQDAEVEGILAIDRRAGQ